MVLTATITLHIGAFCTAAAMRPTIDANASGGTIEHRNIRTGGKLLLLSPILSMVAVVIQKGLEIGLYQDRDFHSSYE